MILKATDLYSCFFKDAGHPRMHRLNNTICPTILRQFTPTSIWSIVKIIAPLDISMGSIGH